MVVGWLVGLALGWPKATCIGALHPPQDLGRADGFLSIMLDQSNSNNVDIIYFLRGNTTEKTVIPID